MTPGFNFLLLSKPLSSYQGEEGKKMINKRKKEIREFFSYELCEFPRGDRGCQGAAVRGKKKVSFLSCVLGVQEKPRKFKLETIVCQREK